ncbi:MAG: hypothetical protein C4570_00355 [Ammonifex sp.]|jgi:hypothetical protein|nr:MAG: hypothetical protein C4570_00355 [Ammonifex sp.]
MSETEISQVNEVLEILVKLKPQLKLTRHDSSGSGWVSLSVFTFSRTGKYYWIVIVDGTFAFKPITPDWIKVYANLILSSPKVYVEWNIRRQITDWAVLQEKG